MMNLEEAKKLLANNPSERDPSLILNIYLKNKADYGRNTNEVFWEELKPLIQKAFRDSIKDASVEKIEPIFQRLSRIKTLQPSNYSFPPPPR